MIEQKLRFDYALCNVWWNKTAQDQPLFNSVELMNTYFDSVRTPYSSKRVNFTIKDSVYNELYFRVENLTIDNVLNKKYMIIREFNDNDEIINTYHFFADIKQDSGNQYYASLERDVIIDYYFLRDLRNRPYTMLYRTHLDRFVNENNTFKINGSNDSPLYIGEELESDTPLCVLNKPINLQFTKSHDIEQETNYYNQYNNLEYIYLYFNFPENNANHKPYYEYSIDQNLTVYVFPYPKTYGLAPDNYIYNASNDTRYLWDINSFFNNNKSLIPYLYNVRISPSSPFGTLETSSYVKFYRYQRGLTSRTIYEVNGNNDNFSQIGELLTYTNGDGTDATIILRNNGEFGSGATEQNVNDTVSNLLSLNSFYNDTIDASYIKSAKSIKKEVKLYNGIIKAKINSANNEGSEYNLLNLIYHKDDNGTYSLNESIVPGITRFYHGLICDNSIYNDKNYNTLKQNNTSVDTTIPYSINQYDTYLAQNKNFYQQTNLQYGSQFGTSVLSNLVTGVTAGLSGNVGGAIGSITSAITSGVNTAVNFKERDYQMDNLKNAPTNVHNLDGNYLLLHRVTGLSPRIEIWQPLKSNLEKIADYLFFNGYNFNKLSKLKDYDNTRKFFNYIQCDINGINYNMNENAYILLRQKLLTGVRFWHTQPDTVDFTTTDNYEVWVDNIEEGE